MEVIKEIVMKKVGDIKPYFRNPRINDRTVTALIDIIPRVGFNVPIVIDKDGIIVKGHARYASALKLGMEEVPCVITTADEDAIRLDRISDNRISEFSEWDVEQLRSELNTVSIDTSFLNFELATIDDLTQRETGSVVTDADIEQANQDKQNTLENIDYLKTVCEKCGHVGFIKFDDIDHRERVAHA
jgi:hypothetical protein